MQGRDVFLFISLFKVCALNEMRNLVPYGVVILTLACTLPVLAVAQEKVSKAKALSSQSGAPILAIVSGPS